MKNYGFSSLTIAFSENDSVSVLDIVICSKSDSDFVWIQSIPLRSIVHLMAIFHAKKACRCCFELRCYWIWSCWPSNDGNMGTKSMGI